MKGQFSAKQLSITARRAARALGMASVRSFDILDHTDPEELVKAGRPDRVVLRVYNSRKTVDVTAGALVAAREAWHVPPARAL
ncbi:MAG: hypothetical protein ACUVS5_11885 [Anaerolineae bacterium]